MWLIPASNPEGRAFIAVLVAFLVLAVLFFGLRIYARRLQRLALDASDYTCLLGVVLDIGVIVILWGSFSHGWGQVKSDFTLADARFSAHIFAPIDIVWNAATVSIRISMLLFYIRIFVVRRFRTICWIFIALNLMNLTSVVFVSCLICQPILYVFDKSIPGGRCGNVAHVELYTAISSLVADSIVVILPMPMIWRLQMHTRNKVGISIVFGMGTIICALTLIRVITSIYYDPHDYTKSAALTSVITGLEPLIGTINACLPFMPSVLQRVSHTNFYTQASAALSRAVIRRSDKGSTMKSSDTSGPPKVVQSGQFTRLLDIEMNPYKNRPSGTTFVSIGSRHAIPHGGPCDEIKGQDEIRGQDRILVRREFSTESEPS